MKCPKCGSEKTEVKDTRMLAERRRRRRECSSCGQRFTTTEVYGIHRSHQPTLVPPDVLKRDGKLEQFSSEKIKSCIGQACSRRPVSGEDLEQVVESVSEMVEKHGTNPVEISHVTKAVFDGLINLDHIAAMRYALQYMEFEDPGDFREFSEKECK